MPYFPDGLTPLTPSPAGAVTSDSLSQASLRGDGNRPVPRAAYAEHLARAYVAPAVAPNMPRAFATGARTVRAGGGASGASVPSAVRAAGDFTPSAPGYAPPGFP